MAAYSAVVTVKPEILPRNTPATMFTCGYFDGNPTRTLNGLWGFCPTTVIAATDCGLGGYCFDSHSCTSGCGSLRDKPGITTWTW
ncbi:hypothetical protein DL546_004194 [Coniochaeta pulveracea]|uniref:Uncharacterized protein n=1 Tax=Coniochaeta pulveracea TaxID=177199 RepID=A0A420Y8C9_9PEZI|nr:hypothetical protein DL546_004194 [Coniochaeta pulveracea]